MININDLPNLPYDVAMVGACDLDDTVGPVCAAAGVVIGIVVNKGIH